MAYGTSEESPAFSVLAIGHNPYALFFGRETNDEPSGRPAPCRFLGYVAVTK